MRAGSPRRPQRTPWAELPSAPEALGIRVVIGHEVRAGTISGFVADTRSWSRVEHVPLHAALHRFPDGGQPDRWRQILAELGDIPLVNPDALVQLCRDKRASQAVIERGGVSMPPLSAPDRWEEDLSLWGAAFLKPRWGAFGEGIRRVTPGASLPPVRDAWVLQRAIQPPDGTAGVCARVLVQREPGGGWMSNAAAVRVSEQDPVVNHARGASVEPAGTWFTDDAASQVALRVAGALEVPHAGELGVDLVCDEAGELHPIEVNAKPRGRLAALAAQHPARFAEPREQAMLRPLRFAAACIEFARGNDTRKTPNRLPPPGKDGAMFQRIEATLKQGGRIDRDDAEWLYHHATDDQLKRAASTVRARFHPSDRATYLIMAIINTTNVCVAKCDYCSFYTLPGQPDGYVLSQAQIDARIEGLLGLGGSLVGFNGGFHPELDLFFYEDLFALTPEALG